MIHEIIHAKIVRACDRVDDWFKSQRLDYSFPFYASFDIRDAGHKVVPVDANIFPAGFNNICQVDRDSAGELAKAYFDQHYPNIGSNVALLAEEHTKNPYYWENVLTLKGLLEEAGKTVKAAVPRELTTPLEVESSAGRKVTVLGAKREDNKVIIDGAEPDLVICNNDFSVAPHDWIENLDTPVNPPHELGWYRRRKDEFFELYNDLAAEFASLIDIDPWIFQIKTQRFAGFDISDEGSREQLAVEVDSFIENLKSSYAERGVEAEPFAFIKNNSGTYGMGITQVKSGDEVRSWTYKARKKMKAAKGGGGISEVIIQEGIPTIISTEEESAEPAIYMIGCQLAGGFLRTHSKKGPEDNLNSPGAVYKRLCVTDLNVNIEGCPLENVYGWIAKLGQLAIAREAKKNGIEFKGYRA